MLQMGSAGICISNCRIHTALHFSSVPNTIWLIYCEVTCFINAYIILQDLGAVSAFCDTHGPAKSLPLLCYFISNALGAFPICQTIRSQGLVCQGGGPHDAVVDNEPCRDFLHPWYARCPRDTSGCASQGAEQSTPLPGAAPGRLDRNQGTGYGIRRHAAAFLVLHRCCWCGAGKGPGAAWLAAP